MTSGRPFTFLLIAIVLVVVLGGAARAAAEIRSATAVVHLPLVAGPPPVIEPPGDPTVDVRPFATGLQDVTSITHAGDERLFAAQRDGRIYIIQPDGSVLPEPFLDIRNAVERDFWEQGLLGLAFAPDYATSGIFYVTYAANDDPFEPAPLVVARYTAAPNGNGPVDPATEQRLLVIPRDKDLHYGGDLTFGPDGYLYISAGDGNQIGGPVENPSAQRGWNLLGKILRIDVDPAHGLYAIPPDNPFVGDDDWRDEIWLYGLRNPWRISFDNATGELYIADVGLTRWEEVNRVPAGESGLSLGWPCYQGDATGPSPAGCGGRDDHLFPIHAYPRDEGRCSVIGGKVYQGAAMPELRGRYLFADLCLGAIWALRDTAPDEVEVIEIGRFPGRAWTTFGEDAAGELYLGEFEGAETVWRLVAGE